MTMKAGEQQRVLFEVLVRSAEVKSLRHIRLLILHEGTPRALLQHFCGRR